MSITHSMNSLPSQNENNLNMNNRDSKDTSVSHSINGATRTFGRELTNFNKAESLQFEAPKPYALRRDPKANNAVSLRRSQTENISQFEKPSFDQSKDAKDTSKEILKVQYEDDKKDEIDPCDFDKLKDPQYVIPYVKEIMAYLRETEDKYIPKAGYMAKIQTDINEKMRAILIDWLVDVHLKFKLLPETLFLTINLIDRYLSVVQIARQKLQLVGVASMLIATKYEEIYPPEVKDFEYVTDRAYTKSEILDMEGKIISALNFNLTTTSSYRFLERYAKVAGFDEKNFNLARYLLELALIEHKMSKYLPSNLACSAVYLVNKITKREGWSETMQKNSQYQEQQVRPCAKDLCILLQNAGKGNLQAVRRKFTSTKFQEVAKIQLDKL